jgi:hypothetical protein
MQGARRADQKNKLGIPDLEHSKAAVLRSLGSADSVRSYQHAIDEFVAWYFSEPRLEPEAAAVLRCLTATQSSAPGGVR